MSIDINFPEKILRRINEISRTEDALPEEIINEAVLEYLQLADPETKTELHVNLSEKYFSEAKELLKEEDYVQASEKLWERRHKWLRRLQRREIWNSGVIAI